MIYVRRRLELTAPNAAYLTPKSGVTYYSGGVALTGSDFVSSDDIPALISNNANITSATQTVYVDYNGRHYQFSVGDTFGISVNGTMYAWRLMGFNHYDLTTATAYGAATASGKAAMLFQMIDCFGTTQRMKQNASSTTGWHNSTLRTWMSGTLYGYLPTNTQNRIKTVNVRTATSVDSGDITTTAETLFLPAEVEIFGTATYAKGGTAEGTRYAWYTAHNTAADRIKNVGSSPNRWWTRSPYDWVDEYGTGVTYEAKFCTIFNDGTPSVRGAGYAAGVSACFCI